jgi:hypothetical protein
VGSEMCICARAGALAPLLARLLDKEPAQRPGPAELREALQPAPARRPLFTRPVTTTLAALLAVVAVVLGALVWSATRDEGGNGDAGAVAPSTQADDGAGAVPGDWVTYTDPKVGYTLAHPPGWRVRALDGTRTDITDPRTRSYLRIDWTDTPGPSPEGAWEAQSRSFGSRHGRYDEIRIDPTSYKGFDAAVWEYAYSAGGARLHAVNLGFVTGTHGFALNFQTHEQRWDGSQDLFEAFKASFRVPG